MGRDLAAARRWQAFWSFRGPVVTMGDAGWVFAVRVMTARGGRRSSGLAAWRIFGARVSRLAGERQLRCGAVAALAGWAVPGGGPVRGCEFCGAGAPVQPAADAVGAGDGHRAGHRAMRGCLPAVRVG